MMRRAALAIYSCLTASAASAAPPPPPPNPTQLAAAAQIWKDHPLQPGSLEAYAKFQIREYIVIMLTGGDVKRGSKRWYELYESLQEYFWGKISRDVEANTSVYINCLATRYAFLSVQQIEELRAFLLTDTGLIFWRSSGLAEKDAFGCAKVFQDEITRVSEEGRKLVGLKLPHPPPRPQPVD